MKYNAPFGSADPNAAYVDRNASNAVRGSIVPASAAEYPQREIVEVIRRFGVDLGITPDNAVLTQLADVLEQTFSASKLSISMPIYPEVERVSARLPISTGTNSVVVDTGTVFSHRGLNRFDTTAFSTAERTLATSASKTFHLRFHPPGYGDATDTGLYPQGRFILKDIADTNYNAGALNENNKIFDTTYDDILFARVVTDGSNVATITSLENRANLFTYQSISIGVNGAVYAYTDAGQGALALNWSRTPRVAQTSLQTIAAAGGYPNGTAVSDAAGALQMFGVRTQDAALTRYNVANPEIVYEDSTSTAGSITFGITVIA